MLETLITAQSIAFLLLGIIVMGFVLRLVLSYGQILSNQRRMIKVLEGIYQQGGGKLDDLLPEEYKDKREEKEPTE